jgi:hypothetical protein
MARPNLLRIDDLLLRAAGWVGFLWAVATLVALGAALNAGNGLFGAIAFSLLCATAPVGVLCAGYQMRSRERRAWALHKLVDDHVELCASDLLRDSDFTPASLSRAIRDLNNAGAAFLVWDRKADVVQDGRLRSARIEIEDCESCGAKVSLSLRVGDVAAARCPYCSDPIELEHLGEEKARLIEELETDPVERRARHRREFSVALFVALVLVCWPLAVGYAFWHWHLQQTD